MTECPDCATTLPEEATSCKCGWRSARVPPPAMTRARPNPDDYRPTPRSEAALAKIRALCSRRETQTPNRDWARQIIERHDRGERVSLYALESARAALKSKHGLPEREPGSDDEQNAAGQVVAQSVRASGKSVEAEDTEGRGFESRQPAPAAPALGIPLDPFEVELSERFEP